MILYSKQSQIAGYMKYETHCVLCVLPAKDETHSHSHMKHTSSVFPAKACFRLRVEQYAKHVCSITRVKDLLVGRGLSVKGIGLQPLHGATRSCIWSLTKY